MLKLKGFLGMGRLECKNRIFVDVKTYRRV